MNKKWKKVGASSSQTSECRTICSIINGRLKDDAKRICHNAGFVFAINREDGKGVLAVRDHREDRIKVDIENGIVVYTHIG